MKRRGIQASDSRDSCRTADTSRLLLFPARDGDITTFVGRLGSPERRLLNSATSSTAFIPPDRLVFVRGPNLMAQRCDPKSWKPTGRPAVIGVAPGNLRTVGTNPVTASAGGILVYPRSQVQLQRLAWFSREDRAISRLRGARRRVVLARVESGRATSRRDSIGRVPGARSLADRSGQGHGLADDDRRNRDRPDHLVPRRAGSLLRG